MLEVYHTEKPILLDKNKGHLAEAHRFPGGGRENKGFY